MIEILKQPAVLVFLAGVGIVIVTLIPWAKLKERFTDFEWTYSSDFRAEQIDICNKLQDAKQWFVENGYDEEADWCNELTQAVWIVEEPEDE